ncbi:hypothetical protein [Hymenobacter actinosclerus]|nr:hypothetical protein [Hymenobacter actinosclerus]
MKHFSVRGRWLGMLGLAATLLLAPACQRHPYRIPDPQGPPQPKVKRTAGGNESADGRALDVEREAVRTKKNVLDKKTGLVKKPKLERRRLKRKTDQRKFLGIPWPF